MSNVAHDQASETPHEDALAPSAVARRHARLRQYLRERPVQPLTPERLRELGTGGPWSSDEDFDDWLAVIYDARHRDVV